MRPAASLDGWLVRLRLRMAWWQPAGFAALLGACVALHLVLRLGLSSSLTIDDSREAMFAQTLEWGYQGRQPPLYNWLVWAAARLFGIDVFTLTLVKYLVLAGAYGLVYASARRILPDARLAALAALSLVLMVPIGWVPHEALTHSLAALAAAAGTFHALLRVEATGSRRAYLALGTTLGLGFLSKFSFGLFAGALLLAALTVEPFRVRLLHRRVIWTLAVPLVLLLPFGLWFHQHDFSFVAIYREQMDPGEPEPWLRGVVSALYYTVRVTLYYLTPLWIVLLVLFPEGWRRMGASPTNAAVRRLLGRFFLAELAIVLTGALIGGVTYLKFRWLMPAYFLFPLYFLSRLDPRTIGPARIRRLAGIVLVAEVAIVTAFVVNILRGDRLGRASHLNVPYPTLAHDLVAAGFTGGTIAAGEGALAGNLKVHFPAARVIRLTNPDYVPPWQGSGQCLVVWEKEQTEAVPAQVREWLEAALGARLPEALPGRVAEARYIFARRQTLRVRYVLLPDGGGQCR